MDYEEDSMVIFNNPNFRTVSTLISNCCAKLLVLILFPVTSIVKSFTGFNEKL